MGLDRAGSLEIITARSGVGANDTAYPAAATDGIAVPPMAKGGVTHVLVRLTANNTSGAALVTLFGYVSSLPQWFALAQLNAGATITRTTLVPAAIADGNNADYAETFTHISAFDRLDARLTSIAGSNTAVTVRFAFETP